MNRQPAVCETCGNPPTLSPVQHSMCGSEYTVWNCGACRGRGIDMSDTYPDIYAGISATATQTRIADQAAEDQYFEDANARLLALSRTLSEYCRHWATCDVWPERHSTPDRVCTCGLDDAIAKLEAQR